MSLSIDYEEILRLPHLTNRRSTRSKTRVLYSTRPDLDVNLGMFVNDFRIHLGARSSRRWPRANRWRLDNLPVYEYSGPFGHFAHGLLRGRVQSRLVLILPVQLASIWFREVLWVDETAKRCAWVFTEYKDLVTRAFVEPRLYHRRTISVQN